MPILSQRQEPASKAGPSAGITFAATFGGILLLGLVVLAISFFCRRRELQRGQEMARQRSILFDSGSEEAKDRLMEKEPQGADSPRPSNSGAVPLLISPDSASSARPLVPRITIPTTSPLIKSTFMDPHNSAVQSACMDSSESAYSQFSATQPATLHAGPSVHFPVPMLHSAAQPYDVATTELTSAAQQPLVTAVRARLSLHPFTGTHVLTVSGPRTRMESITEIPSPFIFAAAPGAASDPARPDSYPVSPMSKLSSELEEFMDDIPEPPSAAVQSPETPGLAAYLPARGSVHITPLQIRKNGP
ncbi:hypothetical protein C8R47DRAFT_1228274 [Mycena vitilis]|nr:hypothetical protein C8R47DRAFT_1228274 [Mycena vitilis]